MLVSLETCGVTCSFYTKKGKKKRKKETQSDIECSREGIQRKQIFTSREVPKNSRRNLVILGIKRDGVLKGW